MCLNQQRNLKSGIAPALRAPSLRPFQPDMTPRTLSPNRQLRKTPRKAEDHWQGPLQSLLGSIKAESQPHKYLNLRRQVFGRQLVCRAVGWLVLVIQRLSGESQSRVYSRCPTGRRRTAAPSWKISSKGAAAAAAQAHALRTWGLVVCTHAHILKIDEVS